MNCASVNFWFTNQMSDEIKLRIPKRSIPELYVPVLLAKQSPRFQRMVMESAQLPTDIDPLKVYVLMMYENPRTRTGLRALVVLDMLQR